MFAGQEITNISGKSPNNTISEVKHTSVIKQRQMITLSSRLDWGGFEIVEALEKLFKSNKRVKENCKESKYLT